MGRMLIAVVSLIVGPIAGVVLGGGLLGGAMMRAGAGAALSAEICATVKATQEEGIMTAELVDQVLNRAAGESEVAVSIHRSISLDQRGPAT